MKNFIANLRKLEKTSIFSKWNNKTFFRIITRLQTIGYILFSNNYIFICVKEKGDNRITKLICRTDYDDESDLLTLESEKQFIYNRRKDLANKYGVVPCESKKVL